ncbi:hypothetical protein ACHHRT_13800, partial [Desulfurivibrio sp. D14AmB]|uniref:hypothetical protein n=1 Tax=Desulfurivibrio sp. D14AmB TaxID=3374370 RepID=UPI00376EA42D
YNTALKDVSNLLASLSVMLTAYLVYSATDSLWTGLAAGAIDGVLTVLAGVAAKAMFGLFVQVASPILVSVFVVLSVAFVIHRINALIIETYFLARSSFKARLARSTVYGQQIKMVML